MRTMRGLIRQAIRREGRVGRVWRGTYISNRSYDGGGVGFQIVVAPSITGQVLRSGQAYFNRI